MSVGAVLGGTVIAEVGKIIDNVYTSKLEKAEAERQLLDLMQRPDLAQIEVNKTEAAHASMFVAGWRPFLGWVCGVGLAYHFIVRDFIAYGLALLAPEAPPLPLVDTETLLSLVLALLGLGSMRTLERIKGVAPTLPTRRN